MIVPTTARGSKDMIIVHGTIPIKSERRDQALDLARWMEYESRREDGCISYEFFVGLSDPNTLMLFQEWETPEALAEHFNTDHMERFLEALPQVLDGRVSTRRYAVEQSAELEDEDDDFGDEGFVDDGNAPRRDEDDAPIIH
jgi:quinol monooxygenase YgiN